MPQSIYYHEEKKHAGKRLVVVLIVSIVTFFLIPVAKHVQPENVQYLQFIMGSLLLLSTLHFLIVSQRPFLFATLRKILAIIFDLLALTLIIALFGDTGLYFFPFYVLLVMQSGLSFEKMYFYLSVALAAFSWIALLSYSEYWSNHPDIVIAFAVTTFLVPIFYLSDITRVHAKNMALNEELSSSEYEASYDALTGLANRKTYEMKIAEMIAAQYPFALIFIDLNKFKVINDTHGHHIGDEVLIEVSKRLYNATNDDDFLSRLGGDEFVIITQRREAFLPKFLKHLEQEVIGKHHIEGLNVFIKLSMGVSTYPDDALTAAQLSKHADTAMYSAKKRSDTYHVFHKDLA